MARRNNEKEPLLKGVLTHDGARRANNLIHDLLRPGPDNQGFKKKSVTFILDEKVGYVRELTTGITCEIQWVREGD